MADKKLNEVPVVSDIVTIFGKRSNGEIVQIDKSNLATLLGELVNDTYESFSLESGVETQIAYGTGAYYICGPVSDTLSCIAVVNYYSVATLGVVGGLTFRVAERTLYATSDGASDIRVKKIRTKS